MRLRLSSILHRLVVTLGLLVVSCPVGATDPDGSDVTDSEYSTDTTEPPPVITIIPHDSSRLAKETQTLGTERPLNGSDDRADYGTIRNRVVKKKADASVALFSRAAIRALPSGQLKIKSRPIRQEANLCEGERFSGQVSAAFCSGTLVASDLVLTAGHCVAETGGKGPKAANIRFIFGFTADNEHDPGKTQFDRAYIFAGKEMVDGKFATRKKGGEDWALVRLTSPVPERIAEPVTQIRKGRVEDKTKIYVLGYPSGFPLKYAPEAAIVANDKPAYFVADLDTFSGNSGSGVYDERTNELVGILARGETDYYMDERQKCLRAYRCSGEGCGGEDVTRIERVVGLQ